MDRPIVVRSMIVGLLGGIIGFALSGTTRIEPAVMPASTAQPSGSTPTRRFEKVQVSSEDRAAAERVIAALGDRAIPHVADRSGEITGNVRSLTGEPVEGLVIRARCESHAPVDRDDRDVLDLSREEWIARSARAYRFRNKHTVDLSREEWIARSARAYRFRNKHTVDTTTDTNGQFRLESIGPHLSYRIYTPADDYWILDEDRRTGLSGVRAGANLSQIAVPLGHVDVDVQGFDASGGEVLPLELTPIAVRPSGSPAVQGPPEYVSRVHEVSRMWHRWVPDDRRTYAPAGLCEITLDHDGYVLAEPVRVQIVHGETTPVSFSVQRLHRVHGVVRLLGKPVDRGQAYRFPGDIEVAPHSRLRDFMEATMLTAESEDAEPTRVELENGTYEFFCPTGRHTLLFSRGSEAVPEVRRVEITAEQQLDIDIDFEPRQLITVDVRGPDGADSGTRFRLRDPRGGSRELSAIMLDEGSYGLFFDDDLWFSFRDEPDVELELTVRSRRYGRQVVPVKLGGQYEVEFDRPCELIVALVGFESSLHRENLSLELEVPIGQLETSSYGADGSDLARSGEATFDRLSRGEYELSLFVRSEDGDRLIIDEQRVLISHASRQISVTVPPLFDLEVRFPTDVEHVSLTRTKPQTGESIDSPSSGRVATFRGLPAGGYVVWARSDAGVQRMRVMIPGNATVDFVPQPIDRLRVTVSDPEGALAKAGFKNGDSIVAIDGERFDGNEAVFVAMFVAMERETVTFTVLRGGVELELSIDPQKTLGDGAIGGSLDPDGA